MTDYVDCGLTDYVDFVKNGVSSYGKLHIMYKLLRMFNMVYVVWLSFVQSLNASGIVFVAANPKKWVDLNESYSLDVITGISTTKAALIHVSW
jgi:hypothetical protein